MSGQHKTDPRDSGSLPVIIGVVAVAIELCVVIASPNFGVLLVVPSAVLAFVALLIIFLIRRGRGAAFFTTIFLTLGLASWALIREGSEVRSEARWLAGSAKFKAQVLRQPRDPDNALKHIDWDGWGMFAQDTEVYLVFDPSDSLRKTSSGLPCKVWKIQRLERNWYAVTFYTDTVWDSCS